MKNSFFKKHSLSTKIFVSIFIIVGLVLPLHQTQAFFLGLATSIAGAIFALAFQVIVIIAYAILMIAYAFLSLVTSPYFINLPYTSGGIVGPGWEITRNFANMGFIFALLIIGLATALRIGEYQAKKTLPRLVGMILLINFTPVICGLVVDASNIVMNFFIEGISSFSSLANLAASQVSAILSSLFTLEGLLSNHIDLIARSMAFSGFCILTAFFFFLFAILFIMRYVAIWMLVILSPLAFFAYVLPNTRKIFSAWWSQFMQWAFVGVAAAFFLYLAEQLLVIVDTGSGVIGAVPAAIWAVSGFSIEGFNEILKFAVIDVFLIFGFLASLSSGATGASAVIKTAKSWGKSAVGNWKSGTGAIGQAKKGTQRAGQAIVGSQSVGKVFDDLTKSKNPITSAIGLKGKEIRGNLQKSLDSVKDGRIDAILSAKDSTAATAYFASPLVSELNKIKLAEGMAEKWDEEDRMKVREGVDLTAQASRAASWGLVNVAKKMVRDTPSLAREKAISDINIDPRNITDLRKKPLKGDLERIQTRLAGIKTKLSSGETLNAEEQAMANEISKHFGYPNANAFFAASGNDFSGSIEDIIGKKGDAYYAIAGELGLERTMAGMKGDSIAGLSNDSLSSKRIQQLAALHWTSNKFDNVFQSRGPSVYKDFITGIKDIGALELARKNPKLGRAAYSGMLTDKFDKLYTPDNVLIKDAEQWDEYVRFANSDPMNPVPRPKWMGPESGEPGPATPPPPPSPVSGAPGFVQTPSGLAVPGEEQASRRTPPSGGKFGSSTPAPTPTPPVESPGDRMRRIERGGETGGEKLRRIVRAGETVPFKEETAGEKLRRIETGQPMASPPTPTENPGEKLRRIERAGQLTPPVENPGEKLRRIERAGQLTPPVENPGEKLRRIERGEVEKKTNETANRLNFGDLMAGGQNGSVFGAKPCVIQGKAGMVKEVPFEVYKDPLSGLDRIRKTDGKNPNNLFITDTKAGKAPTLVKNNEGVIINEDMSYKIGNISYRLSGNKFIIGK